MNDLQRKDEFDRNAAKVAEAIQQFGLVTEDAADVADEFAECAHEPEGVPDYVREEQAAAIAELNDRATAGARTGLRRIGSLRPTSLPRRLMPANYGGRGWPPR